jgi:single-strand DNA-binding protein
LSWIEARECGEQQHNEVKGTNEECIMAKSVNKVFLLGHVRKDPEIRSTPGGMITASLSLATSERYKDRAGEWQEHTEWHNLVAYARGAEILRDYAKKGSKLHVEGRLVTRSWDDKDTGKKVYRTEIVVGDITLLGSNENGSSGNGNGRKSQSSGRSQNHGTDRVDEYDGLGITADDVPF